MTTEREEVAEIEMLVGRLATHLENLGDENPTRAANLARRASNYLTQWAYYCETGTEEDYYVADDYEDSMEQAYDLAEEHRLNREEGN